MQTKRQARRQRAAVREEKADRQSMETHHIDFSTILDVSALKAECEALAKRGLDKNEERSALLALLKKASLDGREEARRLLIADGSGLNCAHRISWLQDQIITILYDFTVRHV